MKRSITFLILATAVVLAIVVLASWMLTAANVTEVLRSPLSPEGIRWLFGHYVDTLTSEPLAWLVLVAMAYGAFTDSGLRAVLSKLSTAGLRQRFALRVILGELVTVICLVLLLTAVPHSILLSVTGNLWSGNFAHGFIPLLCFTLALLSLTFGILTGRYSRCTDFVEALGVGFHPLRGLFVWWLLFSLLWHTLIYVFPSL